MRAAFLLCLVAALAYLAAAIATVLVAGGLW